MHSNGHAKSSASVLLYLCPLGLLQLAVFLVVFYWQGPLPAPAPLQAYASYDATVEDSVIVANVAPLLKQGVFNATAMGGVTLTPMGFYAEDLPFPYVQDQPPFNEYVSGWIVRGRPFRSEQSAAKQLHVASFGMDVAALKYLLYDVGLPPNLRVETDSSRTALHILCMTQLLADANSKGQYIPLIEGQPNWLTKVFDPPMPLKIRIPLNKDIMKSLEKPIDNSARWLLRAGADVNALDDGGATPLHHACYGGLLKMVRLLIEHEADVRVANEDLRTPLHYALANGHAEIGRALVDAGADLHAADLNDVRPLDMLENPGPIAAVDAMEYFGVEQRPVKQIDRIIHPELSPGDEKRGWRHGTGGWSTERLSGFEEDMHCDIDQYWADEITGDEVFDKYLARSAPVLVRGLLNDWPMVNVSHAERIKELFGHINVLVSNVPYADKFGGDGERMDLRDYVTQMQEGHIRGGRTPWYVFKGHNVPKQSESDDSLVKECIAPPLVDIAMRRVPRRYVEEPNTPEYRRTDTNLQWNLGFPGSGSPMHFHNIAWTGSMFGAKKWIMTSPHDSIMSNKPMIRFYEEDMSRLVANGLRISSCVQTAGDVMFVPENWGHGVLNIQQSSSVAVEQIDYVWRFKEEPIIVNSTPRNERAYLNLIDKKEEETKK